MARPPKDNITFHLQFLYNDLAVPTSDLHFSHVKLCLQKSFVNVIVRKLIGPERRLFTNHFNICFMFYLVSLTNKFWQSIPSLFHAVNCQQ